MHRHKRKILIALAILLAGGIIWYFDLSRAGDCLLQGGRWNAGGAFCRLDRLG